MSGSHLSADERRLLECVAAAALYWQQCPELGLEESVTGAVFSVLSALDGEAGGLVGGCKVYPAWDGAEDCKTSISGRLHERFHEVYSELRTLPRPT